MLRPILNIYLNRHVSQDHRSAGLLELASGEAVAGVVGQEAGKQKGEAGPSRPAHCSLQSNTVVSQPPQQDRPAGWARLPGRGGCPAPRRGLSPRAASRPAPRSPGSPAAQLSPPTDMSWHETFTPPPRSPAPGRRCPPRPPAVSVARTPPARSPRSTRPPPGRSSCSPAAARVLGRTD